VIPDEPVRGSVPPPWFWALSGIERMRAVAHGLLPLPPLLRLQGIRPAHVGPGSGTYTMPASAWLQGPAVFAVEALVEAAVTGIAMTTLPPGVDVEPVTLVMDYFRPPRAQPGNLLARARVVNASRFFTFTEVEIEDPQGRLIAHGGGHARIRAIEPAPPPPPAELRAVEDPAYGTPDPILRPVSGSDAPIELWQENDGYTVMRMYADGRFISPLQKLCGLRMTEVDRGRVVGIMPASEWFCRYSRTVAPGVIAGLAGMTGWWANLTLQRPGESFVVLEGAWRFHRTVAADGRMLRAEASWENRPEKDPLRVDVHIYDADGALVAWEHGIGVIIPSSARQRRPAPEAKRILATLLFTDIVGSTEHADKLGDARWRALLDQQRAIIRREMAEREGVEVDTAGDGFLARFDSPARALECARAVRDDVKHLGIEIRAGIHTGECELQSGRLSGIAVHIAARVQAAAGPGEIFVSATVKDLVIGSAIRFEDRGEHSLKGVPGEWRLYSLVG
jgi:class 3 adenylate cyclase/acyl-coenzyme A thioesterase PaaI-like protein